MGISAFAEDLHSSIHTITSLLLHLGEHGRDPMWNFSWSKSEPLKYHCNGDPDVSNFLYFFFLHLTVSVGWHFPPICGCCYLQEQLRLQCPAGAAVCWAGRAELVQCLQQVLNQPLIPGSGHHLNVEAERWYRVGEQAMCDTRKSFAGATIYCWGKYTLLCLTTLKFGLKYKWWWKNSIT